MRKRFTQSELRHIDDMAELAGQDSEAEAASEEAIEALAVAFLQRSALLAPWQDDPQIRELVIRRFTYGYKQGC